MIMRSPNPTRLSSLQRARLRKVLRSTLICIVALEVLVLAAGVIVPSVRAGVPVIDLTVGMFTSMIDGSVKRVNSELDTANGHLQNIRTETTGIHTLAKRHSQQLSSGKWEHELDDVTKTPTQELRGISFASPNPGDALKDIVPGAVDWNDYYTEYLASADTVLSTLRSSMDVLYAHNQQIEDATRLDDIARMASNERSRLAMGELKVQSNLEVARQLHALRSQQALETSLFAITESHVIGSEARSVAEDKRASCSTLSALLIGALDSSGSITFC